MKLRLIATALAANLVAIIAAIALDVTFRPIRPSAAFRDRSNRLGRIR